MTTKSKNMLAVMIALASQKHVDQTDKAGKPYVLHVLRVMNNLNSSDEELCQIAVGHDLVEDSDVTIEMLRGMGFSERVCSALRLMTKEKGMSYEDYIERICTNYDAVLVKMADLIDNSNIQRLKGLEQKDFERMQKYHRAYKRLEEAKSSFEQCIRRS